MTLRTARRQHARCLAAILAVVSVGLANSYGQYNQQKQQAEASRAAADSAKATATASLNAAGYVLGQYAAYLQSVTAEAELHWDEMTPQQQAAYQAKIVESAQQYALGDQKLSSGNGKLGQGNAKYEFALSFYQQGSYVDARDEWNAAVGKYDESRTDFNAAQAFYQQAYRAAEDALKLVPK